MKEDFTIECSNRTTLDISEQLYRYDICISHTDFDKDKISLSKFNVIRYTAACYVICNFGLDKFVLKAARKRFAYPTKEDAWKSLVIRCKWRIRYAERDLEYAKRALDLVEKMKNL